MSRRGLTLIALCALVPVVIVVSAVLATSVARDAMVEQVHASQQLAATERSAAIIQALDAARSRLDRLAARAGRLDGMAEDTQLDLAMEILMAQPAATAASVISPDGVVLTTIGVVDAVPETDEPVFIAADDAHDVAVLLRAAVRMPGVDGVAVYVVQELSLAELVPGFGQPFAAFEGATSLVRRSGEIVMTTTRTTSTRLLAEDLLDLVARGEPGYLQYWSPRFESDRVGVTNPVAGTDLVVVVSADADVVGQPASDLVRELFAVLAGTLVVAGSLVAGIVFLARRSRRQLARTATLANVDPLTGLTNRRGLDERIETMGAAAVLAVDLDGLKRCNDTFGHAAGDLAIVAVADALHGAVRNDDVVARVGGDEFIVVLPGADRATAERVVTSVRAALDGGGVGISVGIAVAPPGSIRDALVHADDDLYVNKRRRPVLV